MSADIPSEGKFGVVGAVAMKESGAQESSQSSSSSITHSPSSLVCSLDQEMNIYLKIVKTVPLKVNGSDTIGNLKEHINQKEGIREMNQYLFFDGNLLTDGRSLVDCGIQRDATLHLVVKNSVAMKIFVKIPSNLRIITLEARACDTVHNIKTMIQEKEGILSDSFTLVCDGNLLEDDRILASLNLRNNSTIHLVFCKKEVLSIFVKARNMKAVKLSVKVMFTVGDVKAIVGSMVDLPVSQIGLFYAGKQLEDSKTLAFYDIKEGSSLELLRTWMQIFVKTWSGKTLTLDVKEHYTVEKIKAMVFRKLQDPMPSHIHFNIYYAGKRLEDARDLASYSIQSNSTLHMVFAASSMFKEMQLNDIFFHFTPTTVISSLKSVIQLQFDEPVKEILFEGMALDDEQTLAYYNIKKNSKVVVVL